MAEMVDGGVLSGPLPPLPAAVDGVGERQTAKPGQRLIEEGCHHYALYMVLEGTAMVMREGRHIARVVEGGVFGEAGVLAGTTSEVTVVAESDMLLLVVPQADFPEIARAAPWFTASLLRGLALPSPRVDGASAVLETHRDV